MRDGDTGGRHEGDQAGEKPGTKCRKDRKEIKQEVCIYETTGSKRRM